MSGSDRPRSSPNALCQDEGQPLTRQMVPLDSAIRLLDQPFSVQSFGDILETGRVSEEKING